MGGLLCLELAQESEMVAIFCVRVCMRECVHVSMRACMHLHMCAHVCVRA